MAPESTKAGILFYGMAGAGKTSCAVELTYRYETGRFQNFLWYKAPDEGSDIEGELQRFALKLESSIPGLTIVESVDHPNKLVEALPSLRRALEQRSVLLVMDNIESLLSREGTWRDALWKPVLDALLAHSGNSRLIVTSRRRPVELDHSDKLLAESIDALSLNEAVLLAHELPNLGRLLRGQAIPDVAAARHLVNRVLSVVQGHPKLIDFAEAHARDPELLAQNLDRAEAAWSSGQDTLHAFFETGESRFKELDFLNVLTQWTHQISASLPHISKMLLHFLCVLEEADRESQVLGDTWDAFIEEYHRGEEIRLADALQPLVTEALLQQQVGVAGLARYSIHPAVVEGVRSEIDAAFADLVNDVLAQYWIAIFNQVTERELGGLGSHVVRAALSAVPYLMRKREWYAAAKALEAAALRDSSASTLAGIIPLQRRVLDGSKGSEQEIAIAATLAGTLLAAGRKAEARDLAGQVLHDAEQRGHYRSATAMAGLFAEALMAKGELELAAQYRQKESEYLSRTNLGPWSRLLAQTRELREMNARGAHREVIAALNAGVLEYMQELPEISDEPEAANAWQVRETVWDTAHTALLELQQWGAALNINAQILASKSARGAPELDLAHSTFNDYYPLVRLGRLDEARNLLNDCREKFERANAIEMLGKLFSALSTVEYLSSNLEQSITFEQTALRYKYLLSDPETCGVSHFNLANRLFTATRYSDSLAHRFAAAVIALQMSSGRLEDRVRMLALTLRTIGAELPRCATSFDELCGEVERVQGVTFRDLYSNLPQRLPSGDQALQEVLTLARAIS